MAEEFDPKLKEGIEYFEQMLQVMPDDRTTLEFLCVAYEQVGEPEKQRKAFIQLAKVLIAEKDLESADRIAERLERYEEPDAKAAVQSVRSAHAAAVPASVAPVDGEGAVGSVPDAVLRAVKAERMLVRNLVQRRMLDENLAATVMQRLAELAAAPGVFLVSALAVLEKENTAAAEEVVASLADAAGTVPMPLEAFEVQKDALKSLPELLVKVRGVLPFAKMDDTLLVAVLNPLDEELSKEVAAAVGGPCRFYLASPRTMEEILEKV